MLAHERVLGARTVAAIPFHVENKLSHPDYCCVFFHQAAASIECGLEMLDVPFDRTASRHVRT